MRVINGYCAGLDFKLEGTMESVMGSGELNQHRGNAVVVTAQVLGHYTQGDAPFYYGKINRLSYIISHEDLFDELDDE